MRGGLKRRLAALGLAAAAILAAGVPALADSGDGWRQVDGDWYYYAGGEPVTSAWQPDGNGMCYLGEDGRMVTGLVEVDGETYYLQESGATAGNPATGWQWIDDGWRWFDEQGVMARSQWIWDEGYWYYAGPDGELLTGLQTIGGETYYFNGRHNGNYGLMLTGPVYVDGEMLLFDEEGAQVVDADVTLLDEQWHVNEDGVIEGYVSEAYDAAAEALEEAEWTLKGAYDYVSELPFSHYDYRAPDGVVHSEHYAAFGFEHMSGNCYIKSAMFYQMARLLGYEVYLCEGWCQTTKGPSEHAWCEVVLDGKTYVMDLTFPNDTGMSGYKLRYGQKGTYRYMMNFARVG